jgi:hypothetical protein
MIQGPLNVFPESNELPARGYSKLRVDVGETILLTGIEFLTMASKEPTRGEGPNAEFNKQ